MTEQGKKTDFPVETLKVHLAQYRCGAQGNRSGTQGKDWFSSLVESEVTCKRCISAIRRCREAEPAFLTQPLQSHGPCPTE
jgi:hypothetical protein